jgi:hypothetical protein
VPTCPRNGVETPLPAAPTRRRVTVHRRTRAVDGAVGGAATDRTADT